MRANQLFHTLTARRVLTATFALALGLLTTASLRAQDAAEQRADEVLGAAAEEPPAETTEPPPQTTPPPQDAASIDYLKLVFRGGLLMLPIGIMSVIVVAIGVERGLALRRLKIMPPQLVTSLSDLSPQQGGFDPRKAYRICQQFPSTAATVIRAMLLKVGRPHSEVEHTVAEAMEREAARLYGNVRTLNLAAAVTPLIGLLGTVFGMIGAFYQTANLPVGANKATALADGIYVALVTTAGGLTVAIPAAILAHLFEGRIQKLFREIDELLFNLLPQVERFEGKLRVSQKQLGEAGNEAGDAKASPPRQPAASAQ